MLIPRTPITATLIALIGTATACDNGESSSAGEDLSATPPGGTSSANATQTSGTMSPPGALASSTPTPDLETGPIPSTGVAPGATPPPSPGGGGAPGVTAEPPDGPLATGGAGGTSSMEDASADGGALNGGGAGGADAMSGAAGMMGVAGAGGADSNSDMNGAAGAMAAGGSAGMAGTDERYVCPPGPFPEPMVVSSENVCQGFNFTYTWNEGPTWVASQGAFYFSNFVALSASGGEIIKYTPGAGCEVFMQGLGCNGLAVSNDGNLLAACQETRSVLHIDLETKETSTIADSYMGTMLDTPNDLIQHSNGSVYFTNPTNELAGRPVGVGPGSFRVDPDGTVSLIAQGNCNGIALSPDESKLYVVLQQMWDLDAEGVPSNPQNLFTRGDGMGVDCAGNVYADGSIFNPAGQQIGSWGSGTNLAFGGEDGTTVLVAGPNTQLRQLTVNVPGLP